MTIERLQNAVQATGTVRAIAFLNRDCVAASPDVTKVELRLDANGRMTRIAPAVKQDVMAALAQHFVSPEQRDGLAAESRATGRVQQVVHFPFLEAVHGVVDQQGLDRLMDHEAIHSLHYLPELSIIRPVETNDVGAVTSGPTWGLKFINVDEVWKKGYTGKNVVVAHLDSGVDSQHAALRQSLENCAKFDVDGRKVDPPSPYQGYDDHGTHTAGTIAGRAVRDAPVIGVAPDVELIDATIVGGGSSPSRVIAGMNWSLEKGARVMNLSVGFRGYDPSLKPIIEKLRAQQLLPVVAIGNDSAGNTRSPGNYKSVLSVGATDENGNVVGFSSSAKSGEDAVGPAICAPGMKISSAKRFGGYFDSSGTSMAAPHVAGLAALLFSAKPNATIDEIQQAIIESCQNPKQEKKDRIGAGIPDAVAALEVLLGK